MTLVYDVNGEARDLAWLAANYDGCHPEYASDKIDVSGYSGYFRLAAVYCTTGDALAKVEVRNSDGTAREGNWACMSYPSLENPDGSLADLTGSGAPYVWTARGVAQQVSTTGFTGFGLGPSYGPLYQMWIVSPSAPSDCLVGAGMKGGTNHVGPLHPVFVLSTADQEPEGDEDFVRALAMSMSSLIARVDTYGNAVTYSYMEPLEVAQRAREIERLLRQNQ